MKKESSLLRLLNRDDVLRVKILKAGFATFLTTNLLGLIQVVGSLITGDKTFSQIQDNLSFIISNIVFFILMILYSTVAKKKHFKLANALILTALVTVLYAFMIYNYGHPINMNFFLILTVLYLLTFFVVRYIFNSLKSDLDLINPSDDDTE